MTKYGRSPWIDRFPKSRVPALPGQRGPLKSDVVIIGGGLTGCATAYAFAVAGVKVVLLEAGQIGRGNSGSSGGWISEDPGVPFADLEKALGPRGARRAWQGWRRAALDFAALLRRLDVKCYLDARPAVTVAVTPDQVARLTREQQARRKAGLDAPILKASAIKSELGLDAAAGLRAKDGATVDPYRACLGLAAAAAQRGAVLFERSPCTKGDLQSQNRRSVHRRRQHPDEPRRRGHRDADRRSSSRLRGTSGFAPPTSRRRHRWPAKIRQELGRREAVMRDYGNPPHMVRWVGDDRLLVSGADADAPPPRLRDKTIVQRTGQLMYELSTLYPDISGLQPEYGWAADYARSADGLPCIGAHRNFPHHLFAFGDASHSITGAFLASRIIVRQHFDEMDPADEVFGFHR